MASTMRYVEAAPPEGDDRRSRIARDDATFAAFHVQPDTACAHSLSLLIEGEIIPRLMVAHADVAAPVQRCRTAAVDAAEIAAFAPLVMQVEADELLAYVETLIARGVSVETLMIDLLAPTARLLGEDWEEDRADFVDVTMGLWRLQEVIHEIADRVPVRHPPGAGRYRALFAAMPGDQHSFGTLVIDEVFRRDGWQTYRIGDGAMPDLLKAVAQTRYDLVGLTVSCDCHIDRLPSVIAALRNVSCNPQLCVMVGGRIFSANPVLAVEVGADGTAQDARAALTVARALVREREGAVAAYH